MGVSYSLVEAIAILLLVCRIGGFRMGVLVVDKVSQGPHHKTVHFEEGPTIICPRFRRVKAGEEVIRDQDKFLKRTGGGSIVIHPPYTSRILIDVGNRSLPIDFHEPLTAEDWKRVDELRKLHYRQRVPFGPRAILLASSKKSDSARKGHETLGFIEAGFAPICNSARDRVLDTHFSGGGGVRWKQWRHAERGKYGHLILGVSRVVVHPRYRGIGLGSELLNQCTRLLRDSWESRRGKPLFLEIVADMLKYSTFPRKAGFHFVGMTEGNLRRVAKDLRYHFKQLEAMGVDFERPGIERMQQRGARLLRKRVRGQGVPLEQVLSMFRNLDANRYFQKYDLFHDIVRLPKPTWMCGLTERARSFLVNRVNRLPIERRSCETHRVAPSGNLRFEGVSVERVIRLGDGERVVKAASAFGISPSGVRHQILSNVSFEITPGDICIVAGPSGCGKSTLLRLLARDRIYHTGHIFFPRTYRPKLASAAPTAGRVINVIQGSLERAMRGLAVAGLSDARIYIQDVSTLSQGQKERFRLAELFSSDSNTWLIDDFAAFLDDWTAMVVAKRLRHVVRNIGVTLILASPRSSHLVDLFRPEVVLQMRDDGSLAEHTGDETMEEMPLNSQAESDGRTMDFARRSHIPQVRTPRKTRL